MKNSHLKVGCSLLTFQHRHTTGANTSPAFLGKRFLFCSLKKILMIIVCTLSMLSCSNDFDNYFKRPSWLEDPAYEVLQSKGNFTNYLKLVDRTLYQSILKGAGSYTIFAPNDDAFKIYLAANSLSSVDDISDAEAAKIVAYTLVYNSYQSSHLGDIAGSEWTIGGSMRKLTSYYRTIHKEDVNSVISWVLDTYDQAGTASTTIMPYRYLPIFTPAYYSANGLISTDYETFYPGLYNTLDNKINVMGAGVMNQSDGSPEIDVENGTVYETNRVNSDVTNIDEKLQEDQYSSFRSILNRKLTDGSYQFVSYSEVDDNTSYYKKLYPDSAIAHLYYKHYTLPFSFNVERAANTANANEGDAQTLFVPTNISIATWKSDIMSLYDMSDESEIPDLAWQYFLQAHMADHLVWPSDFKTAMNENGEFFNGVGTNGTAFASSGITASRMATNGFLYNINSVIPCGYFKTIYGKLLFDSKYTYLETIIDGIYLTDLEVDFLKSTLNGHMEENITMLLPSNELIKEDGYAYDATQTAVADRFTNSSLMGSTTAIERLKRILRMGVFERISNGTIETKISDFTATHGDGLADYDGYAYAVDYYGDMMRYKDNELEWAGNIIEGSKVKATKVVDKNGNNPYNNGQVFTIDKLPQYSPRTDSATVDDGWNDQTTMVFINNYLKTHDEDSIYYKYWTALSSLMDVPSAKYYTILIPDNDTMNKAIAAGDMPTYSALVPSTGTLDDIQSPLALAFIYNHILQGGVYPDDGQSYIIDNFNSYTTYTASTLESYTVSNVTNKSKVTISKGSGNVLTFAANNITNGATVTVKGSGTAVVDRGFTKSNIIGPRAVIHQVNGYLSYKVVE
jgi:hypothetical protein